MESDGHHAVVRLTGNVVRAWGVVGATRLSWQGRTLLSAPERLSIACLSSPRSAQARLRTPVRQIVSLAVEFEPARVEIDGSTASLEGSDSRSVATVAFGPGEHTAAIR